MPVRTLLATMIEQHANLVKHTEEMLRVKRQVPVENQSDEVRDRTEGEIIAHVNGASGFLETVLVKSGNYEGYAYVAPPIMHGDGEIEWRRLVADTGRMIEDTPGYAEWRRFYYLQS